MSNACSAINSPCLQGKVNIKLITSRGEITLEVDGNASPLTAGNFVDLVSKGIYDGTVFHRVIKEPLPFVVQGGDPFSNDPNTSFNDYGKGSFVDPLTGETRFIPLELKLKNEDQPRYGTLTNDPNQLDQLQLTHQRGSIAMARSQDVDSASAQFYFALRALPELDGRYSVFGKIKKGLDIMDQLEENDKIISAKLLLIK